LFQYGVYEGIPRILDLMDKQWVSGCSGLPLPIISPSSHLIAR
jgi:hypothetical protein